MAQEIFQKSVEKQRDRDREKDKERERGDRKFDEMKHAFPVSLGLK